MVADDGHVYRVHLADPGGRITVREVPTVLFESTERGISIDGTTIVPWHRVVRYTRDVVQPIGDGILATHAEVRAWLDDGSDDGESVRVRADRFDPGPWTADLLIERAVDVEAGTVHLTKVHVPWGRVLEYERVHQRVAAVPGRPD